MRVGETVLALVNGGQFVEAKILSLHADGAILSGDSEQALSKARGASPIGIFLPFRLIRAKEQAKTS